MFRYHDGTAEKMDRVSATAGLNAGYECYYLEDGCIVIRARKFSVYAFGVSAEEVKEYTPAPPETGGSSGGGGGSTTPTVDKSKLDAAITAAGALNKDDYTEESWVALESALAAAKTVDGNAGATQEQVNSALSALTAAQNGLVKKGEEPGPGEEPTAPVDPPKTNNGTGWSYDYDTGEWYFFKNGKLVAD